MENALATIGIIILFAIIGGIISTKTKQPIVLGLLIAGALISPNALNLVNNQAMIDLMIEIGSVLFLFVVGMEFSLKGIFKVGVKGAATSIFKMMIMFYLGFLAATLMGLDMKTSLFVGVILSFSSTVISLNILKQKGLSERAEVPLLITGLVIEDICGVFLINIIEATQQSASSSILMTMSTLILSSAVLVGIFLLVSLFAEKIIKWVTKNVNDDTIVFVGLGACLGFSSIAYMLGISTSIGAFLAGSIVANLKESKKFNSATKPYTMLFSSLFFIAIGTLINFRNIPQYLPLIIVFGLVIILGKILSVGLVTRIFAGFSNKSAVFSSIAMIPLGVFSLMIARKSMSFNLSIDMVTIFSVLIFVTAFCASFLMKYEEQIADLISPSTKKRGFIANISTYLGSFFHEMEIESIASKELKSKAIKAFMVLSGTMIIASILIKVLYPLITNHTLVIAGILIAVVAVMIKPTKNVIDSLVKVFVSIDGTSQHMKTLALLRVLFTGIFYALFLLMSPVILYFSGLNNKLIFITIPLWLLCLAIFGRARCRLSRFDSESRYSVPVYKKFTISNAKQQD